MPDEIQSRLRRIKAKNFKSYRQLDVSLSDPTVVIGANASGKSNFVSLLRLLRDLSQFGLDDALNLQGGFGAVKRFGTPNQALEIGFNIILTNSPVNLLLINLGKEHFENAMGTPLILDYRLVVKGDRTRRLTTKEYFVAATAEEPTRAFLRLTGVNGEIETTEGDNHKLFLNLVRNANQQKGSSGTSRLMIDFLTLFGSSYLDGLKIFDLSPSAGKYAGQVTGARGLDETGGNLSTVLQTLFRDPDDKQRFVDLVSIALPFVRNISVKTHTDRSRSLEASEMFFKDNVPGFLLSDGTVSIVELIYALFFDKEPFIVIEEPEQNLHPSLASKLGALMVDAAAVKQIVITTHDTSLIRQVPESALLCVYRQANGQSILFRPDESKRLKPFLEEMGVADIYAANLLKP